MVTAAAGVTRGTPDVLRTLGALAEPPGPAHERLADGLGLPARPRPADYADVFLFQAYPYASVYVGPEGMVGGVAADRVAGFWRALGLAPPPEPDHIAALLGLAASLAEAAAGEREPARKALLDRARRALLWEHLLSWVVPYTRKVGEIADAAYGAWAGLLREALRAGAAELGGPDELPLHLREAPPMPEPGEGSDALVHALLAPVRSGIVVTRSDLVRAATELGLGLRMGERTFALRSLLEQDAPAVLDWFAASAGAWERRHRVDEGWLGCVGGFWRERASATRRLLERMDAAPAPSGARDQGRDR